MIKKYIIPLILFLSLTVPAQATILDQAKHLLNICEQSHTEHVGRCIGHSFTAILDLIFLVPIGMMDLLGALGGPNAFQSADLSRKTAADFDLARRNLKKLVWFLKKVEKAHAYSEKYESNPTLLEKDLGQAFKLALNELRVDAESESDTIKRIHAINQKGNNTLGAFSPNTDYYTTIRSTLLHTEKIKE